MYKIKKAHRHILRIAIAVVGMALIFNQFNPAKAATDKVELYLNPASGSLNSGAGLSVKVFLEKNNRDDTQYVSAKIKFPVNSLSVGSLSTAGSFFANNPSDPHRRVTYNNNTGNIEITGLSSTNIMPEGTYLVGTINFIGKGFGSAAVSFDPGSIVTEEPGDGNKLTGTRGASYTVTNPAPPPVLPPPASPSAPTTTRPPGTTSSGGGTSASNGGTSTAGGSGAASNPGSATTPGADPASPAGPGDETALTPISPDKPVITNVAVSNISANSALISWETTPILRATLRYGTEPTDLGKEIQLSDVSDKMSTELKDLPPGKTIYFEIAEVQGDQATSYFGDFKTSGQTNGLLTAGMIIGGLIIAGGLLGGAYIFYARRKHQAAYNPKAVPVQSYEAPAEKEAPILAPTTSFDPVAQETAAPPVIAPTVIPPAIQPIVQPVAEMPEKIIPEEILQETPKAVEPPPQPFVPPPQVVVPTANGTIAQQIIPDPLPAENMPATVSRQPDEASTHWPWTSTPSSAETGEGAAVKSLEDDDIPDMYEVGQERLKEVEEHLHPHKH